jgi:hypothetical protein
MLDAQRMLGRAGSRVQLLGIDANPEATSVKDVLNYTEVHGVLGRWRFLTGPLPTPGTSGVSSGSTPASSTDRSRTSRPWS